MLTLCPLAQPKKAVDHESQIEPWLTYWYNHAGLPSFTNRVALLPPKPERNRDGKRKSTKLVQDTSEPSVFHRKQGLEVEQLLSTSGHGRNIFLDIPLLGAFYSPKKGLPAGKFYHVLSRLVFRGTATFP